MPINNTPTTSRWSIKATKLRMITTSILNVTLECSTMKALTTPDSQTLRRAAQLMTTNILGQYISLIAKTTVGLMPYPFKTEEPC